MEFSRYAREVPILVPFTLPGKQSSSSSTENKVHRFGGALFLSIFMEGALGVASATSHSLIILAVHIAFGIALIALSLYVLSISRHLHGHVPVIFSLVSFLALCLAAVSGSAIIFMGNSGFADIDKILALVALLASLVQVIYTSSASFTSSRSAVFQ